MKAWSSRGGVVGITPYAPFIRTDGTPTIDDYIDHVEYAIQLLGPEHVAIATDMFDGKTKVNWAPPWYYPETARNANYVTSRIEGFRTKSEPINIDERQQKRG